MSSLSKTGLRGALLALGAFALLSGVLAAPALADPGHGRAYRHYGNGYYGGARHYDRRGDGHWRPAFPFPVPRVVVGLPLPPVVVLGGPRYGYGYGYDRDGRAYDRGYQDGYDDGYDDRSRDEWRQRDRYRPSRYDDCNCGRY
jgi:hypothetical protein